METKQPKVSVIIPVFNAEKHLTHCIDSVLMQTFPDFELLLIDDGSKDESGKICDEYARKDPRIIVFHKKNGGVSSARNLGLQEAKGEWVTFVDSDDWVDSRALEYYIANPLSNDTLYIQQAMTVKGRNFNHWPAKFKDISIDLNVNDVSDYTYLNDILIYGTPWGKLYNMDIIRKNHLVFNERLSLHEDHCFYFDYIRFIHKIKLYENVGYYYRVEENPSSLSARGNMPPCRQLWNAYELLTEKLSQIISEKKLKKEKLNNIFSFLYNILIRSLRSSFFYNESKDVRLQLLQAITPNNAEHFYHPLSISGKILKSILKCKSLTLKYALLSLIKKQLNK